MLFHVYSYSLHENASMDPPCKNTQIIFLPEVEIRCMSADEYYQIYRRQWTDEGTHHCITKEDGWITREFGQKQVYGIEINLIEELMALKNEVHTDLILTTSYLDHKTPAIEILDEF